MNDALKKMRKVKPPKEGEPTCNMGHKHDEAWARWFIRDKLMPRWEAHRETKGDE